MYDAENIGLIQIEDIKKNNDYAMWLKVRKKADCYFLDEYLGKYTKWKNYQETNYTCNLRSL